MDAKLLRLIENVTKHVKTEVVHEGRRKNVTRIEMDFNGVTHVQRVPNDGGEHSGLLWDIAELKKEMELRQRVGKG